nr:MAG: Transcriptional regulator, AbiEi antitoxin [Bacteriophage sp.]
MSRKKETELQKLIRHINSMDRPFEFFDVSRCNLFFNGTLRKTITYLCKAGYIERIERGRYKRSKTIPDDMKIIELEKLAYKRE